jgi:hypothetical protein
MDGGGQIRIDVTLSCWLNPHGEAIRMIDGRSHIACVCNQPAAFGLTEDFIEACLDDVELDQNSRADLYLAKAEAIGWVRISEPSAYDIAISGRDTRAIQRGLSWLRDQGAIVTKVDIEIDTVVGTSVTHRFKFLGGDELIDFVQTGKINWRN